MKIKLHLICAILVVFFIKSGCKKDSGGNYVRATINGNAWKSDLVTVETIHTAFGVTPLKISGITGNEVINIRTTTPNPGVYPFRIDNVLPAGILSFTGEVFESTHKLKWSTGNETNLSLFSLESSTNGINWTMVGTKNPTGPGSSYEMTPTNDIPAGISYYYRLKITDTNGSFAYSSIVLINGNYVGSYRAPGDIEKRGYDGSLEILNYDQNKKVISGRFHFKVKTNTGQLYTITNGEFSTSY